jgi:hypothetical protein
MRDAETKPSERREKPAFRRRKEEKGQTQPQLYGTQYFSVRIALTGPMRKELNDTWQWSGTNWVHLHPQTSPDLFDNSNGQQVLFSNPVMVYNAQTQQIFLLFGSDDSNTNRSFQVSWVWDGTSWSKTRAGGPLNGVDTGNLLYDAKTQTVLEMTRVLPSTSISFDTTLWKLEGQTWVKLDEWGLQ